ncbi:hypothetical protein B0H19DRAFT_1352382 [Mycena capillaripes]|nr:hypothetical protein B0H19DRAFT_1352382 [Mycena capillaripes]
MIKEVRTSPIALLDCFRGMKPLRLWTEDAAFDVLARKMVLGQVTVMSIKHLLSTSMAPRKPKLKDDDLYDPKGERHPEIREKKRLQMAQRRAAKKADRRRWDLPKKYHSPVKDTLANEDDIHLADSERVNLSPVRFEQDHSSKAGAAKGSVDSQTSAERLAALVLAGMVHGQTLGAVGDRENDGISTPVVSQLVDTPWVHSSPGQLRQQNDNLGISVLKGSITGTGPTQVEAAQLRVARLNVVPLTGPTPAEALSWENSEGGQVPPDLQTLTFRRWRQIFFWAQDVGGQMLEDRNWNQAAHQEFMATAADPNIPVLRIRDMYGTKVLVYWEHAGDKELRSNPNDWI